MTPYAVFGFGLLVAVLAGVTAFVMSHDEDTYRLEAQRRTFAIRGLAMGNPFA